MAKKSSHNITNPFICSGYVSPEYFCDRTEETEELISNLQNGRNTTLIAPRRIGKTGLIWNVFYRLKSMNKDVICVYVDIFSTKNLHEFVHMLGTAIMQQALPTERKAMKCLMEFFGAWRPVFSVDSVTGAPTVSLSMEASQSTVSLKMVFDYLNQCKRPVYIGIDEFQQIANYPEAGTEALLRSYIQFAPNVHFIFAGSKLHMMAQMFNSPERPFFQSTASMGLPPLHEEIYYDFARHFFEAKKGGLSEESFHSIYQTFDGITYNVQQILNRLYETERHVSSPQQVQDAIQHVVNRNSMQYEGLMMFLTSNQLSLLKAIAKATNVANPQSSVFIKRYDLPSASSIKTALDVLLDKELVYQQESGYVVYDRFLALWLKRLP